ncbi:FIST C-terminal domain-containing protein [Nitrosophilus labii]|uniref:FIST C-terminal domain-containing protein n=1 Tax=Nitrosophilus labii TaxID=2706014 RepID=UPI001657334B|nr:FIST C-terminal domain-containing protein [Nitrosophilus labii]
MEAKVYSSSKASLLLSFEDIKNQIQKDFSKFDFLLFSIHPYFPIDDVNYLINKIFKTNNYAAFHTINAFKNDDIIEKAVGLVVFKFNKNAKIKKFYIEDITNYKNDDTLDKTADYLNKNRKDFHIILAGLAEELFGFFIEDLSQKIDYSPVNNIIGGVSSGIKTDNKMITYQFIDNKVIKKGFLILSFENVEAQIDVSLGFTPYGITYKITRAEGTKLFSVDEDKNFAKIAKNFLKGIKKPDIKYLWYLPINILDEKDGYVATLRTIEEVHEDYVKFFAPIKTGQHFKISFATADEILKDDMKCALRLSKKMKRADIAFNFSCVARQYVLEDRQKEEIEIYEDILNTYLFGFFTFGEVGPDRMFKKLKMYNETSLVLVMREL